jgi:hypothetical protein
MKIRSTVLLSLLPILAVIMSCHDDSPTEPSKPPATNNFSFNTDDGNFSASGIYDPNATSGSGVGWYNEKTIAAYNIASSMDVSIALITFNDSLAKRTYSFPTEATFGWAFHCSLNDEATIEANLCVSTSGSVALSSYSGTQAQGTFSGSGFRVQDQAHTVSFTDGTFDVTSVSSRISTTELPRNVEMIIERLLGQARNEEMILAK